MFQLKIEEDSSEKPPSITVSNVHPVTEDNWSKIIVAVPEHIRITKSEKNQEGYGVYCSKSFKKGEVIYESDLFIAEMKDIPEKIDLITNQGVFEIIKTVNTGPLGSDELIIWTYDGFMNHHCNPNTYSDWHFDKNNLIGTHGFKCIAKKDISPGDELTCDYNLFCYKEDDGFNCRCRSKKCYGRVEGFYYLSEEKKRAITPMIGEFFHPYFGIDSGKI